MSEESKRSRRQFNTEQKVAILRRHLVDKVPVSDLCDEYRLQPSVFYQWQRLVFENWPAPSMGRRAPEPRNARSSGPTRSSTSRPSSGRKDEVIAEI